MRVLILILLTFCVISSQGQNKYVCITVDDLPTVTYGQDNSLLDKEITNRLIQTFNKYKIPAIGYVVESKLYSNGKGDPAKIKLLRTWLKNGYDLGNHTYSHPDFNSVTDSVFFNDILKGEIITRKLMKEYGKTLEYFRHPYIHSGMNAARSDSLTKFLENHQYKISPVTIDNDDYLFAKAYHFAVIRKNDSLMQSIGKSYIEYMEKKLLYFEQKSQEVFGRQIVQTLLIHASLLNADYLDELAVTFLKHGYTFVSQKGALADSVYQEPVTFYSKRGISWIFRWGLSKGMGDQLMDGDIETPKEIIQLSKE
jgi:peptidoglycan/xylan/chitin deacetylase (PgdA/CDA1 family)